MSSRRVLSMWVWILRLLLMPVHIYVPSGATACGETTDMSKCLLRQRTRSLLNFPNEKPEMSSWCVLGLVLRLTFSRIKRYLNCFNIIPYNLLGLYDPHYGSTCAYLKILLCNLGKTFELGIKYNCLATNLWNRNSFGHFCSIPGDVALDAT